MDTVIGLIGCFVQFGNLNKMNTVINNICKESPVVEVGSIWRDERKRVYILARVSWGKYSAICLEDGNRWSETPVEKEINAVNGLTFLAQSAKITIN